ncbi:MAG TPA: flagellar motor stator protein MotA [Paenalcaligenes sp.]|nr:flagellar motor stator protein MotA [Paenalcaligenes sp.]
MFIFIGYLIVFIAVFGSFVALGGHLGALYQPFEFTLIVGAALGAYLAASNGRSARLMMRALRDAIKPSPYNKTMALELMSLLYVLLNKARREGLMTIENDIEEPHDSPIFQAYPALLKDPLLVGFISDYMRVIISGNLSPHEVEAIMDQEIETFLLERNVPASALYTVADALPAFGIVAAVLGVIKALASVDQPPAILADLISKAMVGTFLGILLAYGFVAPLANVIERKNDRAVAMLESIKVTLVASMSGYPAQISLEFGRKMLFSSERPTFFEMEERIRQEGRPRTDVPQS